jgi:hypothetical protein
LLILLAAGLLISRDYRIVTVLLWLQGIGVFLLVSLRWPLELALVKLIASIIAGAILASSMQTAPSQAAQERKAWRTGRVFRLLTAALVLLAVGSVTPQAVAWVPGVGIAQVLGSLSLIALGLVQLGLTNLPFRSIVGLLTVLAGFEILYAAVERSILVAGLLGIINLGLALIGAYLVQSAEPEPSSEAQVES